MIRILIADDHQMIRDAWSLILSKDKRFEVIGRCADGAEAVKLSQKLQPDILLLDINMAPFNGMEAVQKIRRITRDTGIIALTMYNHPAYAKKMLKLGAMGYVTKSSPMEEMTRAILQVSAGKIYVCKEMKKLLSESKEESTDLLAVHLLTEREMEIIKLIKAGFSSKEISEELNIAYKTVETHRHNVSKKLKVKNAVSLVHLMNESAIHI